jgi:hypothetical protein
MDYRTLWIVRHVMPADRLATGRIDTEDGVITIALRHGHIRPDLAQAMAAFSRAFAESGLFELDANRICGPPELSARFEPVDDHLLDGSPMRVLYGREAFDILVDRKAVDPALLREMNEEVMPLACDLLVPVSYADRG